LIAGLWEGKADHEAGFLKGSFQLLGKSVGCRRNASFFSGCIHALQAMPAVLRRLEGDMAGGR